MYRLAIDFMLMAWHQRVLTLYHACPKSESILNHCNVDAHFFHDLWIFSLVEPEALEILLFRLIRNSDLCVRDRVQTVNMHYKYNYECK